jgi:hypothetical protein
MKTPLFLLLFLTGALPALSQKREDSRLFTEDLATDQCNFQTTGHTAYFILEPGYQLILKGVDNHDTTSLVITVLGETKKIGETVTRVVEEKESVNGHPVEISRNFFAFCEQTGTIYYFGEEVDIYKNGKIISHDGAWTAEGQNKAGVAMPGLILLGARYYQEMAPGIAMDRAEILSMTGLMKTPAGQFEHVLKTEETSALNPKEKEYKYYAPGIGLIKDEDLLLTAFGFVKK